MPPSKADGLLHHALKADEHRLGAVVPGDDHLGVPRQHGELLVAALHPAADVREPAADWTLHRFQHSPRRTRVADPGTRLTELRMLWHDTASGRQIAHCWARIRGVLGAQCGRIRGLEREREREHTPVLTSEQKRERERGGGEREWRLTGVDLSACLPMKPPDKGAPNGYPQRGWSVSLPLTFRSRRENN